MKIRNGQLNSFDFIQGILLGYWSRQTDEKKIYTDDTKSLLDTRWLNSGEKDKNCEEINKLVNEKKAKTQSTDFKGGRS